MYIKKTTPQRQQNYPGWALHTITSEAWKWKGNSAHEYVHEWFRMPLVLCRVLKHLGIQWKCNGIQMLEVVWFLATRSPLLTKSATQTIIIILVGESVWAFSETIKLRDLWALLENWRLGFENLLWRITSSQPGWTWVTSQQYVFRGERTSAKEEGSRKDLSPARDQESCKRMMVMAVQKSKRVPEKHLFLLYWLAKAFDCVDHNKLWKILKEMGIPDHLTCLLRNFYAGQEATVRTGHGTTDWFPIGKGAHQGCILSPCLFNLYAEYIMRNGLEEA